MADNRLKIRIRRILGSPLRSCKSKDQISDVVSTHSHSHSHGRHRFSPEAEATQTDQRLPLLSPDVNGRKCPPASPIISPLNNFYHFPRNNKKGKTKKYKKRAFEDRFPDFNYVNGLFSSDEEEEEEKKKKKWTPPCSAADSLAVVKRSRDPYSDFRNSMVDMIVEKHIFAAKDLESLLQCFLSLNSYHHHKVIVQVFAEIWEAFFECDHF